jgi:hypothetical protein
VLKLPFDPCSGSFDRENQVHDNAPARAQEGEQSRPCLENGLCGPSEFLFDDVADDIHLQPSSISKEGAKVLVFSPVGLFLRSFELWFSSSLWEAFPRNIFLLLISVYGTGRPTLISCPCLLHTLSSALQQNIKKRGL